MLVIPAKAGIQVAVARVKTDYAPLLRRARWAIGFADVRFGIPGSSPGQALPSQSGLRRNDEKARLIRRFLDDLLRELAKNKVIARFGLAEGSDVEKNDREPEEQALRFFAFRDDPDLAGFRTNLKEFLDDYMQRYANLAPEDAKSYKTSFTSALKNCITVFGERNVFTNPDAKRKRKGLVHYDLLMPTVGVLDRKVADANKVKIQKAYLKLCQSEEFKRTLSGGLQNRGSMLNRRTSWARLLKKATRGE